MRISDFADYCNAMKVLRTKQPKPGVFCEECGLELEDGLCRSCGDLSDYDVLEDENKWEWLAQRYEHDLHTEAEERGL